MNRRDFLTSFISGITGYIARNITPNRLGDKDRRIEALEARIKQLEWCYDSQIDRNRWLRENNDRLRRRLAELEVLADMPYWLDEDESWTARNDGGQVFFVGLSGQDQNTGLSPDDPLPTIAEALKRCDCGPLEIVVQYGQCDQGEQT